MRFRAFLVVTVILFGGCQVLSGVDGTDFATGGAGPGGADPSGGGGTASCNQPADCPDEDTACQTPTCEDGSCGLALEPEATPCGDGNVCDGEGACVDPSCIDGERNHDETDVDCGGSLCPPCVDGKDCEAATHCESGFCDGGICTACAEHADCAELTDHYCNAGVCEPQGMIGASCGSDAACLSGSCADDHCCDSACDSPCDVCDLEGDEGTCTVAPAGDEGDGSCAPYLCDGSSTDCPTSCTEGGDCATGHCADGNCCDAACGGACEACDLSGSEGTCTVFSAGDSGDPSCAPYLCDGNDGSCPTSCSGDGECSADGYCDEGVNKCFLEKGNGSTCSANEECQSGHCVDGYCCDTGCSGGCALCDLSGSEGTCTIAPDGTAGNNCDPYLCDGSGSMCPQSCASHDDCVSTHYCDGSDSCVLKKPNGDACGTGFECASGHCVEGVCCDFSCDDSCDTCTAVGAVGSCKLRPQGASGDPSCSPYLCDGAMAACPTMCSVDADCVTTHYCDGIQCQPKKSNGSSCSGDNQCSSGHCVDGVCCNSACDDGCAICNTGTVGSCEPEADGTQVSVCDPYLCDGSNLTCPTSCSSHADCISSYWCDGGTCQPDKSDGTSCSDDAECSSTHCTDGVCCDMACDGTCEACDSNGDCNAVLTGTDDTCDGSACCVNGVCQDPCAN